MVDPQPSAITHWIEQLKEGDNEAARQLWNRYFDKLVCAAKKRLAGGPNRAADEEDVVVSVFESLCRGAAKGQFERLTDRQDLWMLLLAITKQKSVNEIRRRTSQKRGGGAVRGESVFTNLNDESGPLGIGQIASEEPTPELLIEADENLESLLAMLRNDELRQIATLRMEGTTNDEIAERLQLSERSVRRKVHLIRETWEWEFEQESQHDV